jgi:hypothetical protein
MNEVVGDRFDKHGLDPYRFVEKLKFEKKNVLLVPSQVELVLIPKD